MKKIINTRGGLLFDYDGVLNIGTEILINKIIFLAQELGLTTPSVDYLLSIWGMSWQKLLPQMSEDLRCTNKNYVNFMKKFTQYSVGRFTSPRVPNQDPSVIFLCRLMGPRS